MSAPLPIDIPVDRHPVIADRVVLRSRLVPSGCWEWDAPTAAGYGRMRLSGRHVAAHRVSYLCFVGPIPERMELDHLCRNRSCVNPRHLEPVTTAENTRRAAAVRPKVPVKPRTHPPRVTNWVSHCKYGHPYDEENTYIYGNGRRQCRACQRERERQAQAKRRAANAALRAVQPVPHASGESHTNSKLTEAQVRDIKFSSERTTDLAARFNISDSQVSAIRHGKAWAHVQPEGSEG